MSNWVYDSGGHKKDQDKYNKGYDQIFKSDWPCKECNGTKASGHKDECSKHWKNR